MMKYIRHRSLGLVLFDSKQRHDEIAEKLGWDRKQIMSAGFVCIDWDCEEFCCGGESGTLVATPREDDRRALGKALEL